FQWRYPAAVGWSEDTVAKLRAILDAHHDHVAMAAEMGVNLVAGSDAGSPGVDHGRGLIDEIFHFLDCGMTMKQALQAASTCPRRLWDADPADISIGHRANLIVMDADPFTDRHALLRVTGVVQ
ncbi:MAG: hypothetical protein ACYDCF_01510, partial [Burkholderiales bacterium]